MSCTVQQARPLMKRLRRGTQPDHANATILGCKVKVWVPFPRHSLFDLLPHTLHYHTASKKSPGTRAWPFVRPATCAQQVRGNADLCHFWTTYETAAKMSGCKCNIVHGQIKDAIFQPTKLHTHKGQNTSSKMFLIDQVVHLSVSNTHQ